MFLTVLFEINMTVHINVADVSHQNISIPALSFYFFFVFTGSGVGQVLTQFLVYSAGKTSHAEVKISIAKNLIQQVYGCQLYLLLF